MIHHKFLIKKKIVREKKKQHKFSAQNKSININHVPEEIPHFKILQLN